MEQKSIKQRQRASSITNCQMLNEQDECSDVRCLSSSDIVHEVDKVMECRYCRDGQANTIKKRTAKKSYDVRGKKTMRTSTTIIPAKGPKKTE